MRVSTHPFAAFRTPANGCVRIDVIPIGLQCRLLRPLHVIDAEQAGVEQRILELLRGVVE
jgi:hypothetical protein